MNIFALGYSRSRERRRSDRKFRSIWTHDLGGYTLEARFLARPAFLLDATWASQANSISNDATSFNQSGTSLPNSFASNSLNIDGITLQMPAQTSASGTVQSTASTTFTLPTTVSALWGISINSDITQQYGITNNSNGNTGAGGTFTSTNGGQLNLDFVDGDAANLPPWSGQEYISGTFSINFNPVPGLNSVDAITSATAIDNDTDGPAAVNDTGIDFTSTATGINVWGPATDTFSGNPYALVVQYPQVASNGVPAQVTQEFDGFFDPNGGGQGIEINYSTISSASGDTINYESQVEDVLFGGVTASFQSELDWHFDENLTWPPPK